SVDNSKTPKNEYHYGQTKRVYVSRTFGGNCHYSDVDGDIDAGPTAGKESGKGGNLSVKYETVGFCVHSLWLR
ncbi:unnamed protein product, partial [marine sediment metagenome]